MRRMLRIVLVAFGILAVVGTAFALALRAAFDVPAPLPTPAPGGDLGRVVLVEPGGTRTGPVSVRIEGDRIAAIGPPVAKVGSVGDPLDGAFALPGLTDMHAHFPMTGLPGDEEHTALLYLLHGVTTVRFVGGASPESIAAWRERIDRGEAPGPRMFTCGPILDGAEPALFRHDGLASPEAARARVSELADAGVDCIKAYDRLDQPTLEALRETAHARGLPLIGHTPQALSFEAARLDDVQHLRGVHPPFQGERLDHPYFLGAWLRLDDAWLEHVTRVSLEHGITHTPTLVAIEGVVTASDWPRWSATPGMQLWLPHLRDGLWSGQVGFNPPRFASAETVDMVREATRRMGRTVLAFHRAGVELHTGTDASVPNVVPGASLHQELQLWVRAGVGPEAALEASTRTSPHYLGLERAGALAVGAPADLALFRRDPTRDPAALDSLVGVVAGGRLYTRDELMRRLQRYDDHYDGFAYRRVFLPSLRGVLRTVTAALGSQAP